jgi:26S proteasome regulatory subunit N9
LFVDSLDFIRQKLCIMTLVESVFRRSKEQRMAIEFASLAKECRVQASEVEHLVMKALSLGLIKGHIDEVGQIVQVKSLG